MRQKVLIVWSLCAVILVFGIGFAPVTAEPLLQDAPRLDGVKIYFSESNGETSRFDRSINGLSRFVGLVRQLGAEVETLEWRDGIPADADLLVIAGPATEFNANQTARLWSYMNDGGRVLLLVDPVTLDRGRALGFLTQSGLFQLLWTDIGLRVRNDIVLTEGTLPPVVAAETVEEANEPDDETTDADEAADETAAEAAEADNDVVVVSAVQPGLTAPVVDFVTTELDAQHPITQGLEALAFFQARSLEVDLSVRDFPIVPLAFTSVEFYGENNVLAYYEEGVAVYNIGEDVPPGFLPLAAAYENPTSGLKLVLVSDRNIATNGFGLQSSPPSTGSFLYPDNVRFLLNSLSWLLDKETFEMNFPTPGPTATPTLTPTPMVEQAGPETFSDLAVEIAVSNERPTEGELILYEVRLTNLGPDPALNINLDMRLPTELAFGMAGGGVYDSSTGTWSIDFLDVENGVTLRLLTQVRRGTVGATVTNTVVVTGSNSTDPNRDNNQASIDVTVVAVVEVGEE